MLDRASRSESLSQAIDQPGVTESIRSRHASQRMDGIHTAARSVGSRPSTVSAESRFDENGEPIEKASDFAAMDRYLGTRPGTESAAHALRIWRDERALLTSIWTR